MALEVFCISGVLFSTSFSWCKARPLRRTNPAPQCAAAGSELFLKLLLACRPFETRDGWRANAGKREEGQTVEKPSSHHAAARPRKDTRNFLVQILSLIHVIRRSPLSTAGTMGGIGAKGAT
jgi:hypothetical protein